MSDAKRPREGASAGGSAATRNAQPPEVLADVKSRRGGKNPANRNAVRRGYVLLVMVHAANRPEQRFGSHGAVRT